MYAPFPWRVNEGFSIFLRVEISVARHITEWAVETQGPTIFEVVSVVCGFLLSYGTHIDGHQFQLLARGQSNYRWTRDVNDIEHGFGPLHVAMFTLQFDAAMTRDLLSVVSSQFTPLFGFKLLWFSALLPYICCMVLSGKVLPAAPVSIFRRML